MFQLTAWIVPESFVRLTSDDDRTALRQLAEHTARAAPEALRAALAAQLASMSHKAGIALGPGVLLYHRRVDLLEDIHLAIGLRQPRTGELPPRTPRVLLGMIIPQARARIYLSFLARWNRWLQQPGSLERLEAGNVEDILADLRAFDAAAPVPTPGEPGNEGL